MRHADVLIVGAGHGGAAVAAELRKQGFAGSILMVGRELSPPYERPPLSKEYLSGTKTFERLYLRPDSFWADKNIEMMLGAEVVQVSAAKKEVQFASGERVGFGQLVWAAGGDPRRLTCQGADLAGVHSIRDRSDVDRLLAELHAGARRVVVIGGGYIGLEAAAVLSKLGCHITLLEALPRVLARVAGEPLSSFYEEEHRAHGVDLHVSTTVTCIDGEQGRATVVRTEGGASFECDLVIVGIGIIPAVAPLAAAGAATANGVLVDASCRTTLPNVFAIGDCAMHSNQYADGRSIRLESVQNANDMATAVARTICGDVTPYEALPWFWSNQYDLRLQTVGLSTGYDRTIVRGTPASRSFSVAYLREGRIIAFDCVNAVRDYVQGRKLVEKNPLVDPQRLADTSVPLKEMIGI